MKSIADRFVWIKTGLVRLNREKTPMAYQRVCPPDILDNIGKRVQNGEEILQWTSVFCPQHVDFDCVVPCLEC